jgi:cell division septation protein DedD
MMIRGYEIGAKLIAIVVGAIVLIAAVSIVLTQCSSSKTAKKQDEVSGAQGQASVSAGQEAMNTVSNVASNQAATDQAVAQGQDEVRTAPEADKGHAAVNAACRFKANRNKPECQPKGPAR